MKKSILTITAFIMAAGMAVTSTPVIAQSATPDIEQETAATIINACLSYAEDNDIKISIAVFDASATLKGFARMDGAHNASVKIAQWKGNAAASFRNVSTSDIAGWVQNNPGLAFAPGVAALEGGIPIRVER